MQEEKLATHRKKEQKSSYSTLFARKKKEQVKTMKIEVEDETILY